MACKTVFARVGGLVILCSGLSGKLAMSEVDIRRFHECLQTVISNMEEEAASR